MGEEGSAVETTQVGCGQCLLWSRSECGFRTQGNVFRRVCSFVFLLLSAVRWAA